ncbi:J domain-containing protein [Wolbachia endosymbiont of Rhagoletis indifferens]|uniref:J domain-containing protein n=1 Tax=Wolbachia endosymbiont of Rhagoletis indifferens TaxID=3383250 RepID=UPI003AF346C4
MNRKEALEILGLSDSANPSKRQITIKYKELGLKFHPDKNQNKEKAVRKKYEEMFKQINNAYKYLTSLNLEEISKIKYEDIIVMTDEEFEKTTNMTGEELGEISNEKFNRWIYTTNKRLMKDLNEINSADDLSSSLSFAILNKDVEYLKKLFSKFKSSKDGQFGDYINQPYAGTNLLSHAVSLRNIKIVELCLKNGADPNTEINESFLWNSEVKKLLVEYGRINKSSVFCQLALAVLTSYVAFAIYSSCDASFVCYAGVAALALAAVFLVANAIHDVFYVQTKWPSPNFDEVNAEQVINNVEDNSKRIDNALA